MDYSFDIITGSSAIVNLWNSLASLWGTAVALQRELSYGFLQDPFPFSTVVRVWLVRIGLIKMKVFHRGEGSSVHVFRGVVCTRLPSFML